MTFATPFPATSSLDVTNIAEPVAEGSVGVYLPTAPMTNIALTTSGSGSSLSAQWDVSTVVTGNPVAPMVIVAWNSVPAPGALALLGLAGLVGGRRRR